MTDDLITVRECAARAKMSERTILRHIREIPHYRSSGRGKITLRWSDWLAWNERNRVECQRDEDAMAILADLVRA